MSKITIQDKSNVFFTSDTHFNHANIIEFCKRPFHDVFHQDENLIQLWNEIVPPNGIVFHGGDFIWTGQIDRVRDVVKQLNGDIYLSLGNHCYQNRLDRQIFKTIFKDVQDMYYITVQDEDHQYKRMNFQLCHYPLMYWRSNYYHLHGHVHSGPRCKPQDKVPFHYLRYDIGVDNNDFKPISYETLKLKFIEFRNL